MPTAAVIATQLTDRSARAKTLTVGGLDVLGLNGSSYKVRRESIRLTEAGPGSVSSLGFAIWDPGLAVTLAEGQEVQFWDVTRDVPLFLGFVQSWAYVPAGPSRTITVECIGVEAVLDWMQVLDAPALPAPDFDDPIMAIVAQAQGIGFPLRAAAYPTGGGFSRFDYPVEAFFSTQATGAFQGVTLRDALRQVFDSHGGYAAGFTSRYECTVDFYGNLRSWEIFEGVGSPTDYKTLTISDTVGGAIAATILNHRYDATAVVRGVYVMGTGVAVLVPDGSGIVGALATLSDTTITTAAVARARGNAYLAEMGVAVRGTVSIERHTNPSQNPEVFTAGGDLVQTGSPLVLTDAQAGLSSFATYISSIDKTFNADGTENWTITYGGHPPSAVRLFRHHTRHTRS